MLRNPEIPKLPPLSYKDRKKRFGGGSEISSFLNYERDKSLNVHVIEKPVAQLRTAARLVGETQKKYWYFVTKIVLTYCEKKMI